MTESSMASICVIIWWQAADRHVKISRTTEKTICRLTGEASGSSISKCNQKTEANQANHWKGRCYLTWNETPQSNMISAKITLKLSKSFRNMRTRIVDSKRTTSKRGWPGRYTNPKSNTGTFPGGWTVL